MGLNRLKTEKFQNLQKKSGFYPPLSGPPEAARRLRRLPVGGPPQGENFSVILVIPIEKLMIFINILMFFQSDSTLFSVTHQGVLHVNQQIPTLNFTLNHESRLENVGFPILYA